MPSSTNALQGRKFIYSLQTIGIPHTAQVQDESEQAPRSYISVGRQQAANDAVL
jgi:hypothetical protein